MMKNRRAGFTLLELSIVIAIGAMMAAGVIQMQVSNWQTEQRAAVAKQLSMVSDAALAYIVTKHVDLTVSLSQPGSTLQLGIQDLIAAGVLASGIVPAGATAILGSSNTFKVLLANVGGDLAAYTYLANPVMRQNSSGPASVDEIALGEIVQKASPTIQVGYSRSGNSAQLTGKLAANLGNNPDPQQRAGILAARISFKESPFNSYLPRDGSLPMTGILNMNNQTIANLDSISARNITSTGILSINGLNASGPGVIDFSMKDLSAANITVGKKIHAKTVVGQDMTTVNMEIQGPLVVFDSIKSNGNIEVYDGTGSTAKVTIAKDGSIKSNGNIEVYDGTGSTAKVTIANNGSIKSNGIKSYGDIEVYGNTNKAVAYISSANGFIRGEQLGSNEIYLTYNGEKSSGNRFPMYLCKEGHRYQIFEDQNDLWLKPVLTETGSHVFC